MSIDAEARDALSLDDPYTVPTNHWHGLPDWHPQPHPEPQPHAAIRVRFLISAGCSVCRSCAGSGACSTEPTRCGGCCGPVKW